VVRVELETALDVCRRSMDKIDLSIYHAQRPIDVFGISVHA
jgi:hypothetical protein